LLYLASPLVFKPPDGWVPWDDHRKFSVNLNEWPRYQTA